MSEKTTPNGTKAPTDLPLLSRRPRPSARALAGPIKASASVRDHTGDELSPGMTPSNGVSDPGDQGQHTQQALEDRVARGVHDLDWQVVRDLRSQVTEAWRKRGHVEALDEGRHREPVTVLIDQALDDYSARQVQSGGDAVGVDLRNKMRRGVLDYLFGAGRLEPLVHLEHIENINVDRYDRVRLEFADGRIEQGPAVADSDEDLIAEIQHIARNAPTGEREFNPANKKLRMVLPDGSRLAADGWYTPHPVVSIRKHRFIDVTLDQLVTMGMLDTPMARFLEAAIRAGLNIVTTGSAGAGKTTLLRAQLNALDPQIRLGTVEAQFELQINELYERHNSVVAFEAQEGGEVGPSGRRHGEVSLTDLTRSQLQHNLVRQIVGEVTGPEVVAMLNAMQAGTGSASTLHSDSANGAIGRLVTLILENIPNASQAYAERRIGEQIHLIVHVALVDESHVEGGRKHRFVDEILAIQPSSEIGKSIAKTPLWEPGPDLRGRATGYLPPRLDELLRHGFDEALLDPSASDWGPSPEYKFPPRQRGGL